jgi:hypothetical protein
LTDEERALLVEVTTNRPELENLADRLSAGETLSAGEADRLRSAIGDEIARTGIDDGEINERGARLDDLIDRVGQLSDLYRT